MKASKKNPNKGKSEKIESLSKKVVNCCIGGGRPLTRWEILKLEFTGKKLAFGSKKWVRATEAWIELCENLNDAKGAFFGISRIFTGQLRLIEPAQGLEILALQKLLSLMTDRTNKKEWKFCHRLAFDSSNYTLPGSKGRELVIAKWNEFYRPCFVNTTDPAVAWDARLFCNAGAENRLETPADVEQMATWTKLITDNDDWLRTH